MSKRPLLSISHKLGTNADPKRKAWTLTVGTHNEVDISHVATKFDLKIREGAWRNRDTYPVLKDTNISSP